MLDPNCGSESIVVRAYPSFSFFFHSSHLKIAYVSYISERKYIYSRHSNAIGEDSG
jgi:hypothetical protein